MCLSLSCSQEPSQFHDFELKSLTIEIDDSRVYSEYLYIGNHFWTKNQLWFNTNFSKTIGVDSLGRVIEIIDLGNVVQDHLGRPIEYKGGMVTDFFLHESEVYALYLADDKLKRFSLKGGGYEAIDLPSKEESFFLNFRDIITNDETGHKTLFVISGISGDFESFDLNINTKEIKSDFRGNFVPGIRSFMVSKSTAGKVILFDYEWKGISMFDAKGNRVYDFKIPKEPNIIFGEGKDHFEKWFQIGFEELGARIIKVVGEPEDLWVLMNLNPNGKANGPIEPFFLLRNRNSELDFFQLKGMDQISINEEGLVLTTNFKDKKVIFEIMDFKLFCSNLE